MSFFNKIFGSSGAKNTTLKVKDLIWINNSSKLKGSIELIKKYPDAIVAAWFKETKITFSNFLSKNGINIEILIAEKIISADIENKTVILLEHNESYSSEADLMLNWNVKEIIVLNSFDDKILESADQIKSLAEKIKLKEHETLQHSMYSKYIRRAQKKYDRDMLNNSQPEVKVQSTESELTIEAKKQIIKDFNEIKELLRKDMDKMTVSPGEDPVMKIAFAAKESIIKAEAEVCSKYEISKQTLYSIQEEIETEDTPSNNRESTTLKEAKPNMKPNNVSTGELCNEAKKGNLEKVKQILDNPDCDINMRESGLTSLMWAAHHGHEKIVRELIQKGADLELTNDSGWTALIAASQQGYDKIVESLISAGTDINAADCDGWNALMRAKQNGHTKIINMLKNAGAKLGPGVMWCTGCNNFLVSSSRRLKEMMPDANVIGVVGDTDNCQRCGSRLETV